MSNLDPEETRAFIERMGETLLPLFTKCVIPIFGEQNGAAIQCGTGTLFRVADVSFLVTASHVADIKTKHGIRLYISDGSPGLTGSHWKADYTRSGASMWLFWNCQRNSSSSFRTEHS